VINFLIKATQLRRFYGKILPELSIKDEPGMSTLSIYFLRHGQTVQSKAGMFCGSGLNPELTADGHEMAKCVGEAHKNTHFEGIYSSPLIRAVTTAKAVAQPHKLELRLSDDLREIGYGAWEGKTVETVNQEFHDDYIRWMADPAWCPPTNGETATEIASRGMRIIDQIRHEAPSGNVLVVSHKATIRIILCSLLGIDVGRFRFRLDCPVCSISVVDFTKQGPWLRTLADRSHLSQRLRELSGT
jgi:broad specificity phosphatase PhoE